MEELSRGGDVAEIARRHDVRPRTLAWWRSELVRRARERPAPGPRLLPVVVGRARGPTLDVRTVDALDVVVELEAARVVVRGAVSAQHLAAIVSAARTC